MDNQSIIEAVTDKGFDFNESSLQAKTLAIEKYRQYYESVEKYFLDAGVQDTQPLNDFIHDIASDLTYGYIWYYDQLLHEARPDRTVPLDTIQVNMNDLISYGERIANNLDENVMEILFQKELVFNNLFDVDYLDKLTKGYAVSEEE